MYVWMHVSAVFLYMTGGMFCHQTLRQYKDNQNETEVLMSALVAMQDKTAHLEHSLSAETKLKLELFSALGEAKRQIEIQQGL